MHRCLAKGQVIGVRDAVSPLSGVAVPVWVAPLVVMALAVGCWVVPCFVNWILVCKRGRLQGVRQHAGLETSGAEVAASKIADRCSFHPGVPVRAACGVFLAVGSFICCFLVHPVAVVVGCLAAFLMESMMLTDIKARIIPVELTGAFAACAVVFALVVGSVEGLCASLAVGVGVLVLLVLADALSRRLGGRVGVGMGDKRLAPCIAVLSGVRGTVYGFAAASLLAFLFALFILAVKRGDRTSTIPYAPGLALWCYVGLFMQTVVCV